VHENFLVRYSCIVFVVLGRDASSFRQLEKERKWQEPFEFYPQTHQLYASSQQHRRAPQQQLV
jgi:hypothetical protein